KTFLILSDLLCHVRMYRDERRYQCSQCDMAFSNKINFTQHKLMHIGETREKPYKCNQCNKAFLQNSHFISHMRIHIAEKTYKCNDCDNVFSQKSELVCHM
ncbi:unnamed protein product, partial [Meganyctiphanes norvegica]